MNRSRGAIGASLVLAAVQLVAACAGSPSASSTPVPAASPSSAPSNPAPRPSAAPVSTTASQIADLRTQLATKPDDPATLRDLGVPREDLPALATEAAVQWTGTFNPRPLDAHGARELYDRAY